MEQNTSAHQFYAETYDVWMSDWPGEMEFYQEIVVQEVKSENGVVLDVACGTGRIGIRLAKNGTFVVGLDRSAEMLAIAQQKGVDIDHTSWVEGDMKSFEIAQKFDLAIIPSHSFQNLNTPDDQAACMDCIWRHLQPGGLLFVHLDHMNTENLKWLGEIGREKRGVFEEAEQFKHPETGLMVKTSRAWSYEPASQTAIMQTIWKEVDLEDREMRRWDTGLIHLHCVFRYEMEHLFKRARFEVEHVYDDFSREELRDDSPHMLWLARKPKDDL
jgi:ubiquinone/menaquinone biosynthesis C-methylase UbiE